MNALIDWLQRPFATGAEVEPPWQSVGRRTSRRCFFCTPIGRVQRTGSSLVTYAEAEMSAAVAPRPVRAGCAAPEPRPSYPSASPAQTGLGCGVGDRRPRGRGPADTSARKLRAGRQRPVSPLPSRRPLQVDPGLAALAIGLTARQRGHRSRCTTTSATPPGWIAEAYELAAATGRLAAIAGRQRRRSTTSRVASPRPTGTVRGLRVRRASRTESVGSMPPTFVVGLDGSRELENRLECLLRPPPQAVRPRGDRRDGGSEHRSRYHRKFSGACAKAAKDLDVVALGGR